jgi:hypothetical protein
MPLQVSSIDNQIVPGGIYLIGINIQINDLRPNNKITSIDRKIKTNVSACFVIGAIHSAFLNNIFGS